MSQRHGRNRDRRMYDCDALERLRVPLGGRKGREASDTDRPKPKSKRIGVDGRLRVNRIRGATIVRLWD